MSPWAVRRSYASAGWHLWTNGRDYYAARPGMRLASYSPAATLRLVLSYTSTEHEPVLAHPSMRKR